MGKKLIDGKLEDRRVPGGFNQIKADDIHDVIDRVRNIHNLPVSREVLVRIIGTMHMPGEHVILDPRYTANTGDPTAMEPRADWGLLNEWRRCTPGQALKIAGVVIDSERMSISLAFDGIGAPVGAPFSGHVPLYPAALFRDPAPEHLQHGVLLTEQGEPWFIPMERRTVPGPPGAFKIIHTGTPFRVHPVITRQARHLLKLADPVINTLHFHGGYPDDTQFWASLEDHAMMGPFAFRMTGPTADIPVLLGWRPGNNITAREMAAARAAVRDLQVAVEPPDMDKPGGAAVVHLNRRSSPTTFGWAMPANT